MRKLFAVPALACIGLSCLAVGAFAKPAATGSTPAKLTIDSSPEGVFGYLSGARKSCLANRKVVVYEQQGNTRDPATDRKVGSDKTTLDEGNYRYSVETKSGRFYARAAATKGCAATQTGSVQAMNLGAAAGSSNIPLCSPYTLKARVRSARCSPPAPSGASATTSPRGGFAPARSASPTSRVTATAADRSPSGTRPPAAGAPSR